MSHWSFAFHPTHESTQTNFVALDTSWDLSDITMSAGLCKQQRGGLERRKRGEIRGKKRRKKQGASEDGREEDQGGQMCGRIKQHNSDCPGNLL